MAEITRIGIFAADMSLQDRILLLVLGGLFGVILILIGIQNIRTGKAEETGSRRLVNSLLGQSNTYEGGTATALGVVKIIGGVGMIIVAIVVFIWGPIRN